MYYQHNFKQLKSWTLTLCFVPYVSIAVITCRPSIRLEHSSNRLTGGISVIIHDADPSIFFSDHNNESQEAWGVAVTMTIRMGTPTVECLLHILYNLIDMVCYSLNFHIGLFINFVLCWLWSLLKSSWKSHHVINVQRINLCGYKTWAEPSWNNVRNFIPLE